MQLTSVCSFWVLSWSWDFTALGTALEIGSVRAVPGKRAARAVANDNETPTPGSKAPGYRWEVLLLLFSRRLFLMLGREICSN